VLDDNTIGSQRNSVDIRMYLGTGKSSPVECMRRTKNYMHAGAHNTRDATTTSRSSLFLPPVPWSSCAHFDEPLVEAFMVDRRAPLCEARSIVRDRGRKRRVARQEEAGQLTSHIRLVLEAPLLECFQPRSGRDVRPAQPPSLFRRRACRCRHLPGRTGHTTRPLRV